MLFFTSSSTKYAALIMDYGRQVTHTILQCSTEALSSNV